MIYMFSLFRSHIHQNITMRFLTCEPNFNKDENYVDQADKFYQDPAAWIRSNIPVYPQHTQPTHLIFFENLLEKISDFLNNYEVIHEIPHSEVTEHSLLYYRYLI